MCVGRCNRLDNVLLIDVKNDRKWENCCIWLKTEEYSLRKKYYVKLIDIDENSKKKPFFYY